MAARPGVGGGSRWTSPPVQEETVTGPHDPEEHPEGEQEPWYGTGYDDDGPATSGDAFPGSAEPPASDHHPGEPPDGPTDPPTQPGIHQPDGPATVRDEAPGPAAAARPGRWRSRRVRVGAAATLAGLVLLGGGF